MASEHGPPNQRSRRRKRRHSGGGSGANDVRYGADEFLNTACNTGIPQSVFVVKTGNDPPNHEAKAFYVGEDEDGLKLFRDVDMTFDTGLWETYHCGESDYRELSDSDEENELVQLYLEDSLEKFDRENGETAEKSYWDTYYSLNCEPTEYLMSMMTLAPVLLPHMRAAVSSDGADPAGGPRTLVPGCGNCSASCELFRHGITELWSQDISAVVISQMKAEHPDVGTWDVGDATAMRYHSAFFDCVVDKSLIDCLFYTYEFSSVIPKVLQEYCRVLKPQGVALVVTTHTPCEILPLLHSDCGAGQGQDEGAAFVE